ncbi:MAG: hypothetical protein V5B39_12010 [Accumulibacter sp.]|jgi:hypothetical protein|uniref:hypothetical protein n=1 Tax=Accumulibacter sp. TaxID=2053492 RepID=UPI002FC3B849
MQPLAIFRQSRSMLLLGCALLATNVSAAVLVEHLPATIAVGQQADNSTPPYVADLTLGPASINRISWWGYYDGGSPVDDSFSVRLEGIAQGAIPTSVLEGVVDGFDLYRYDLTLPAPFAFAGGGMTLELELINASDDVQWFWQGMSSLDGMRAVRVEGSAPVPEPGIPGLLAIASMALVLSSRRRAAGR